MFNRIAKNNLQMWNFRSLVISPEGTWGDKGLGILMSSQAEDIFRFFFIFYTTFALAVAVSHIYHFFSHTCIDCELLCFLMHIIFYKFCRLIFLCL